MEVDVKREIVAIVTVAPERILGGVPTFLAQDDEERNRLASTLAVILRAAVHDLGNGAYILVKH